jgi:periplasmic divalent cation tolerance protein
MAANGVVLALTTYPSSGDVGAFAHALVERHVIACANIVPAIRSIYRWEGAITEDAEQLVVMKLASAQVETLKAVVRELHPYDNPELVVLDVRDGLEAYLGWVLSTRT